MSPRSLYRSLAFAEAVTWTLLIIAMVIKYVFHAGDLPVQIAGSIHGFVFISYALAAGLVGVNQYWSKRLITLAVATAVLPYATVPFDLKMDRSGKLDGDWRRSATADPRDHTLVSRLLRWMLRRPALLGGTSLLTVVVIMGTLLIIGPPGGQS
ncbi:DUF3817 domain-containing protein [Paeniglutamicibacter gangotriensis]|uniref:Integral membrane protein n=1 Tax=Paeniglutamicibacter gangotriensis Lz1y TaxID=1276920 RepID=M7NDL3_9MICC|nr:DUF3817 domain-containing protein [Paeniglutamicibacter gangotriensis]EMQ96603.1 integral membrane protein [Paeniglutamicibacter gangotriensis Lz1y]